MNWLAHVFLSEPNAQFQLGNLLADVVRGPQRDAMSAELRPRRGLSQGDRRVHRRSSRGETQPRSHRQRASALQRVLIDGSTTTTSRATGALLAHHTRRVRRSFLCQRPTSPPRRVASGRAGHARTHHPLRPARLLRPSGGCRARAAPDSRPISTHAGKNSLPWTRRVRDLLTHSAAFAADFDEFFPALQAHVAGLQN